MNEPQTLSIELLQLLDNLKLKDVKETNTLGLLSIEKLTYIFERVTIENSVNDIASLQKCCWLWNGYRPNKTKGHQHGKIWYKGNYRFVHRLMFHNFIDNVPEFKRERDSLQINHSCSHDNNGRCINPWHLYLGTPKQNTQDLINDGNLVHNKGTTKGQLFADNKDLLIKLREEGKSLKYISEMTGLPSKTINRWVSKLQIKKDDKYDIDLKSKVLKMKSEGIEIKDITSETGVSKSTILRWQKK